MNPFLVLSAIGVFSAAASYWWARRRAGGERRAATFVTAFVVWALAFGMVVLLQQVFARARGASWEATCRSSMKQAVLALRMYADENGGRLPVADHWCDAVMSYASSTDTLHCPEARGTDPHTSFVFNAALSGAAVSETGEPAKVVLIFEGDGNWNAHGDARLLSESPRHRGGDHYAFGDGRVEWLRRARDPRAPFWRNQTLKQPEGDDRWRP